MNTEMFAARQPDEADDDERRNRHRLDQRKQGPQQMLQHGDAAGGEAEQYAGQKTPAGSRP